jgi:NAD(P)-dependent dehydrogenase (short-subunit alcohol dehydrogenase family)
MQGKVAVVTGAGSGIGATAGPRKRAGRAHRIRPENAEREAGAIRAEGREAIALAHDVADESAWERVTGDVLGRFGRLDALVNCTGVTHRGPPEEETLERWRALMAVNLDGVFLGTKHAIRAMRENRPAPGGPIVNLSSAAGLVGLPLGGAYCASKGGVRLYTKSTALHCAGEGLGVRANSVHLAYVRTPMVEAVARDAPDLEARWRELAAAQPMGRVGEPEDVAYGVLYLASDEARFVTGAELVIDGGYTAQQRRAAPTRAAARPSVLDAAPPGQEAAGRRVEGEDVPAPSARLVLRPADRHPL